MGMTSKNQVVRKGIALKSPNLFCDVVALKLYRSTYV